MRRTSCFARMSPPEQHHIGRGPARAQSGICEGPQMLPQNSSNSTLHPLTTSTHCASKHVKNTVTYTDTQAHTQTRKHTHSSRGTPITHIIAGSSPSLHPPAACNLAVSALASRSQDRPLNRVSAAAPALMQGLLHRAGPENGPSIPPPAHSHYRTHPSGHGHRSRATCPLTPEQLGRKGLPLLPLRHTDQGRGVELKQELHGEERFDFLF